MAYQVLARSASPFVRDARGGRSTSCAALTHALEQQRAAHHAVSLHRHPAAWADDVARILAKALNCETGITAHAVREVPSCLEIDAGRFVDRDRMDAATNTRSTKCRQLLDNAGVRALPGRFKGT